ncbi:MAG: prephenate dehydrogenase [Clostridiales bacterium]|nr:prephenate dehydrogenase [Clostridiales bacterium]
MSLKKIGFIGLGLIGGSIAKKLHMLHPTLEIIATAGHIETIKEAYGEHLITNDTFCNIEDFADCDYIFLCTPVQKNIEYLRQLKDVISPSCIITDVGSVKTEIHREVTALHLEKNFIGGHPMAGSEKTGILNASDSLLENAYYIITPTSETSPEALADFTEIVASLDAIPLVLDYELHDYATAAISHLPHIIAYSLVNLVKASDDAGETMKAIAAGGFKDITRIASSSPVMWENICLSNREQILKLIDAYIETLQKTRKDIEDNNAQALIDSFSSAKDYRDSIAITQKGALKNVYELYLDLLDEAGGIATVATLLAGNHLSIKNIGIVHNREFESGVLHLEMYDAEALDAAVALLKKHHYTIYER